MGATARKPRERVGIVLLMAVLVGFALRVYLLAGQDLWGDEGFTTYVIGLPWAQVLRPGTDTHPPLYYALLKAWAAVAVAPGLPVANVFGLRFLSIVFSSLMTPLAALAGRWLFGPRVGLIAAWLMALSPVQVYYAQELRMYAQAACLALAATVCLVALLSSRWPTRGWAVYGLVTLAGLYTHYGVFFILPAHGLAALTADDRRWTMASSRPASIIHRPWSTLRWLAVMGALALAYLPWVVGQARSLLGHAARGAPSWTLGDFVGIAGRGLVSYTAGLTLPQGEALAVGLGVALGALGVWAAWRRAAWRGVLLAISVASPLVVGWLVNPLMPFFHERFVLMGAATLLVAVAGGMGALVRRPLFGGAALVAVVALNLVALNAWFTDPQYVKSDYRQAIRAVLAQARPGDLILLNNGEQQALFDFYVPDRAQRTVATLSNDDVLTPQRADRALSRLTQGHDRVWLVNYGDLAVYDPQRHAEGWLAAHGYRALFQSHLGFEVALYLLATALPPATPTTPAEAQFADGIRLLGVDLQPQPAQPGGALLVTLYWQAVQPPGARYTVFTHLVNAAGQLVAQFDGEPVGGTAPTTGWPPGATVVDRRAIALPPDLPPGAYTLRVGLYSQPSLERLAVQTTALPVQDNAVTAAPVQIAP